MNLDDLRAVQVDERGTDSLQSLRPTFYADAADYLADLRERRDRLADRADDPFDSAEVRQLTDELETAEEVVEAIYERRVGKLVKRASLAANGVPTDAEGLTDEETELFADLVERLEAHRAAVLDDLAAEAEGPSALPADGDPSPDDEPTPSPRELDAVDQAGGQRQSEAGAEPAEPSEDLAPNGGVGAPPAEEAAEPTDEERVTVRMTAEVGEIYGVDDRVYTLGDEDVVTLPRANAAPLLDRGAAQRLE